MASGNPTAPEHLACIFVVTGNPSEPEVVFYQPGTGYKQTISPDYRSRLAVALDLCFPSYVVVIPLYGDVCFLGVTGAVRTPVLRPVFGLDQGDGKANDGNNAVSLHEGEST